MTQRIPLLFVAFMLMAAGAGCESLALKWPHELQPHRLWRLNRQPDTQRNVYYSVPDTIPERTDDEPRQE